MSSLAEPNVGHHIRVLREKQGLSLRALSERSGLSVNAISLIERGANSPTVSSLHLLAMALGVPISTLFADPREQNVVATPATDRPRVQANGITLESLGTGLHNQQVEPFLISLEPGAGNIDQPLNHAGEEFVYCLEGEISYSVGGNLYRLSAGDSLLFQASEPHAFHNPGAVHARMIVIFGSPQRGQSVRHFHLEPLR